MTREGVAAKADRLLTSGRVHVLRCQGSEVIALVHGDTEGLHVVRRHAGRWSCDCSAIGPCSHGIAASKVTGQVPAGARAALVGGAA